MTMYLVAAALVVALLIAIPSQASAFKDRDCSDFKTQKKAQKFYKKKGGPRKDPHRLDADRDGIACESNPCPCKPKPSRWIDLGAYGRVEMIS